VFCNEEIDDAVNDAGRCARGRALRAAAANADAVLVVTPEYNGSFPAVIKNAIDWLSRPYGNSAVKDKPLAVIGGSFGQYGGVWSHDATRKSFGIAGASVIDAIKLSVPFKTLDDQAPQTTRSSRRMSATLSATPAKSADPSDKEVQQKPPGFATGALLNSGR
jgi:NAD(P)H-dependent FMN reductase